MLQCSNTGVSFILSPNMTALPQTELTSSGISHDTATVLWDTTKATSFVYRYVCPYFGTRYHDDAPSKVYACAIRSKITIKLEFILFLFNIIIFINCNWVITRWQCSDLTELPLHLCHNIMDAVEESAFSIVNGVTFGYGSDKLSRNVIK
jgi:hypothetical protein